MAQDRRYKTFTYKRASCDTGTITFQQKMRTALQARSNRASDRCYPLDVAGVNLRLVDDSITQNGMLFGIMFDFTKGSHQPIVGADLDQPTLSMSLVRPPTKKEFVENVLFFGIKANHVILVQSLALRAKQFEGYCNWLLQPPSNHAGQYHPTYLTDLPPEKFKDTSIKNVKSIQLSKPISVVSSPETAPETPTRSKAKQSSRKEEVPVEVTGFLLDLIKNFTPTNRQSALSSMSFDEAVKAGRVRATVLLEVQGKMDEEETVPFMDEFAHALRHVDEDDLDYTIKLHKGEDIKAGEVKLQEKFLITCPEGHPRTDEIRTTMHTWLESSIAARRVYD